MTEAKALLIELARKSRVAEWDGDLHARIASALALDEEREERRLRANFEGIDTHSRAAAAAVAAVERTQE